MIVFFLTFRFVKVSITFIASNIEQLENLPPPILYTSPALGFLKYSQKQLIRSLLCRLSLTCLPLYPIREYLFFI